MRTDPLEVLMRQVNCLDSMSPSHLKSEDIKSLQKEFFDHQKQLEPMQKTAIEKATSSEESFEHFVVNIQQSWKTYLNLLGDMNELISSSANKPLLKDLLQSTYSLNSHLYFITEIEKEVYEELLFSLPEPRLAEIMTSVQSLPTYLAQEFPEQDTNIEKLTNLIKTNSEAGKVYLATGKNMELFKNVLENTGSLKSKLKKLPFTPENSLEKSLVTLMNYDHFVELFLRKSKILLLDASVYANICNEHNEEVSFKNTIKILEEDIMQNNLKYPIQKYSQNSYSCGVTCLMNVLSVFNPKKQLNWSMEKKLLDKVTVGSYWNNIPSSLARVANEQYNISSKMLLDMKTFKPLFFDNPNSQQFPPFKQFLEDYKVIEHENVPNLTETVAKNKLDNGSMIAYVTGSGQILHYRLIYGYEQNNNNIKFNIFDPNGFDLTIEGSDLPNESRNDKSFWAIEYTSENKYYKIKQHIKIAGDLI